MGLLQAVVGVGVGRLALSPEIFLGMSAFKGLSLWPIARRHPWKFMLQSPWKSSTAAATTKLEDSPCEGTVLSCLHLLHVDQAAGTPADPVLLRNLIWWGYF